LFTKALKIFNAAKKFGLNSQLQWHVKTVHENAKDFGCSICAKKFGSYSRLHHHFEPITLGELKLTTEHQFHSMDILHKWLTTYESKRETVFFFQLLHISNFSLVRAHGLLFVQEVAKTDMLLLEKMVLVERMAILTLD
jgi:hypothetical protein